VGVSVCCLTGVNPQVALCEEQLCVRAVTLGWELVQGLSSNPQDFWPALRGFVGAAFHRSLLELEENQAPELTSALKQVSPTPTLPYLTVTVASDQPTTW